MSSLIRIPKEAHAHVQDVPASFNPTFTETPLKKQNGATLKWEERVQVAGETVHLQIGMRWDSLPGGHTRDAALVHLRTGAWHALEMARLGHHEPLKPFHKSRHAPHLRPVMVPSIPKEALEKDVGEPRNG